MHSASLAVVGFRVDTYLVQVQRKKCELEARSEQQPVASATAGRWRHTPARHTHLAAQSSSHRPLHDQATMGNNKFIVFGGGGHVGQAFARQAVAMGAEVTSVVRDDSQ